MSAAYQAASRTFAAIVVMLAMAAVPATASAAASWTTPVTLGSTGRESGPPEIAIAPDGEAIATWESGRPNGIQVSTRRPGKAWTPPVTLATVRESEGPYVVANARKAVVVWSDTTHARGGETSVVMAATRLRGKRWGRPKNISAEKRWRSEPEGREPQVAITPGGKATVLWAAGDEGHSTASFIKSATQSASGTGWAAPIGLPRSIEGQAPEVAMTPTGEAVAIWGASYDEESGIEVTSRPPNGLWKGAGRLATPGSFPSPHIAITSKGEAIGAWVKESEDSSRVVQVAVRKPGAGWKVRTLAPKDEDEAPTIVTEPGGRAKLVWIRSVAFGPREVVTSTHSHGGAWTAPVSLAEEGLQLPKDAYPEMAVTGDGESIAVWQAGGLLGEGTIIQSAGKARGQPWSATTDISSSPPPPGFDVAADPKIAIAPRGEAFAVWRCFDGTEWVVQAATRLVASPSQARISP
jgi:hypothetical protein